MKGRMSTDMGKIVIDTEVIAQYVGVRREKKCLVTAWCPEIMRYVTMYCYVPDVTPIVGYADEKTIEYDTWRIAFTGYGGEIL